MLLQLNIRNFALIDKLSLDFESGLNTLTGETGAGKSILIGALQLVLGARMDLDQIRDRKAPCVIQAVFDVRDHALSKEPWVQEFLSDDDEHFILKREVNPEGRSKNSVNGQLVNLSVLKQLGDRLIDIHGQHDHQMIFNKETHASYIDRLVLAGSHAKEFESLLNKYQVLYDEYRTLKTKEKELESLKQGKARELDLLQFQVDEIEKIAPEDGELEPLREEKIRLAHAERLHALTDKIQSDLDAGSDSASSRIAQAFRDFNEWVRIDSSVEGLYKDLEGVQMQIEELLHAIRSYQEGLSFDEGRIKEVEQRLDDLEKLQRKYGAQSATSLREVLDFYEESKQRLDQLVNSEVYEKDIKNQLNEVEGKLNETALKLSGYRKQVAKGLKKGIEKELLDLAFKHASFECRIQKGEFNSCGYDDVEFLISPNAGEESKEVSKVASGGEASRMMLAMKKALAHVDHIPSLVFDEIDTNIGGRLGTVVGEKMKGIASNHQVLLITHLPQIASFANHHIKVEKKAKSGKTLVSYRVLEGDERVSELAQMMAGEQETSIAKTHAKEMLKMAEKVAK